MNAKRLIVWCGGLILAPAAAIANGQALWYLATGTGWDPITAVLLPLSVDGNTALAMYLWRKGANDPSKRFGKWVALLSLAVSSAGAAGGHLLHSGQVANGVALTVLVGAIPAVALATFIEALVLDAGVQVKRKGKANVPSPKVEKTPETPTTVEKSQTLTVVPDGLSDVEKVRTIVAEHGPELSRNRLQELLRERYGRGLKTARASELLVQVREAAS